MTMESVMQSLQASIGPCIFVSGVGLLLMSMTNRLARAIDHCRLSAQHAVEDQSDERVCWQTQTRILLKRCQFLQTAIVLATSSIFFVSIVMFLFFATLVWDFSFMPLIYTLFALSLASLIVSLLFFLLDIRLALFALKKEIRNSL